MLEACRGGVVRLEFDRAPLSMVPGAWSVTQSCADWPSFGLLVGVLCSFCVSWGCQAVYGGFMALLLESRYLTTVS